MDVQTDKKIHRQIDITICVCSCVRLCVCLRVMENIVIANREPMCFNLTRVQCLGS